MKPLPRPLKITFTLVLILFILVILLFAWLISSRGYWEMHQRRDVRKERLIEDAPVPESARVTGGSLEGIPLNRLRYIATHNSYHRQPDPVRLFFMGLVEPAEPAKLSYTHPSLLEQLAAGIRSFEWDIRVAQGRFILSHVPLVDNLGPHPDMALTLTQMALWSRQNPGHAPLIIILELKEDWMVLNPLLETFTAENLAALETLASETLGDLLFTPDDFRGDRKTMAEARSRRGWPEASALQGRFLLVIHTDERLDPLYSRGDAALSGRAFFTSSPSGALRDDAVFIIHNDPERAVIAPLVEAGYMVRTRADADLRWSPSQREASLDSGAQILSTDFPPGHENHPEAPAFLFQGGTTLNPVRP